MLVLIAVNRQDQLGPHAAGAAVDGELVTPVLVGCTEPDRCPCSRSWAGLVTAGFSELAEIADRPNLDRGQVRRGLHDLLDRVGWIDDLVQAVEAGECHFDGFEVGDPVWAVERTIDDHLAQIDAICREFPVGTVVSRLGDLVAPALPRAA